METNNLEEMGKIVFPIERNLVKGKLREIAPYIFGISIKDPYQRAMLFCRYQEFYESPFKEIRGKSFTLEDYMDLYRRKNKKSFFSYPTDWSGYNIPSEVLKKAYKKFLGVGGSPYDEVMFDIIFACENSFGRFNQKAGKWYLIGADSFSSSTMDHEIAHGLYYTNDEYKEKCDFLISKIKKSDYNGMKKQLIKIGYADDKKIIDDEIQAYMSTGLIKKFDTKSLKKYTKDFKSNFKNYASK